MEKLFFSILEGLVNKYSSNVFMYLYFKVFVLADIGWSVPSFEWSGSKECVQSKWEAFCIEVLLMMMIFSLNTNVELHCIC